MGNPGRKLAVIHHRYAEWVPALKEAEPRLDIRGAHPREWESLDQPGSPRPERFCWNLPEGLIARMPSLAWVQNSGAGVDHLVAPQNYLFIFPSRGPTATLDSGWRVTSADTCSAKPSVWMNVPTRNPRPLEPQAHPRGYRRKIRSGAGFRPHRKTDRQGLRELGMDVTGVVREAREDAEFRCEPRSIYRNYTWPVAWCSRRPPRLKPAAWWMRACCATGIPI